MKTILSAFLGYLVRLPSAIVTGWDRFFFTPSDPIMLGVIRICVGCILLYIHLSCASEVLNFVGPDAWIDQEALPQLAALPDHPKFKPPPPEPGRPRPLQSELDDVEVRKSVLRAHGFSIWHVVTDPHWVKVTYYAGIGCVALFTLGLFTRFTSVLSWAFHLSYMHRSLVIWFGMDAMISFLLLYLALGPCNAVFSLDRLLKPLIGKPSQPAHPSWWATVSLRLIQLHMCVVYFISGIAKLQGRSWWDGTATWITMNAPLFNEGLPTEWMTNPALGEWFWHYVSFASTYATLAFEITFPFLIWNRHLRPWILAGAALLHGGIALFMGLGGFGAIMLTGCLAFIPSNGARWFLSALRGKSPETSSQVASQPIAELK
jgi:hypothetical protein